MRLRSILKKVQLTLLERDLNTEIARENVTEKSRRSSVHYKV